MLKNKGYEELEDVFVSVSIPELGVEKRAYFEDLTPEDNADEDKRDSAERTVYLNIPSNAKAGVYELKVESYNADSRDVKTGKIAIVSGNEESRVIAPITSKHIDIGKTESFDIVVVNSGSSVAVYEIVPESNDNLIIRAESQILTVKAGSSETAKVNVKAVKEGTYNFAVSVESDGKLVKKVSLTAVAEKQASSSSNIVILTIVLVIVLVVLLIVLIVLLTRKPAKEAEESYY